MAVVCQLNSTFKSSSQHLPWYYIYVVWHVLTLNDTEMNVPDAGTQDAIN